MYRRPKPWFFEKLDGSNYYDTTECITFFRCPRCKEICTKDLYRCLDYAPQALSGFECECGHVLTDEEVKTWTHVPYDQDFAREYRRKHGF